MEFLEAYKYAKKYRTSFRLPGMNYILIPKKKDVRAPQTGHGTGLVYALAGRPKFQVRCPL